MFVSRDAARQQSCLRSLTIPLAHHYSPQAVAISNPSILLALLAPERWRLELSPCRSPCCAKALGTRHLSSSSLSASALYAGR